MRLAGVQVGRPVRQGNLRTGYGKKPVPGVVRVGREGLEGDGQADRRFHGGPEKAVLAYGADHYPLWRAELQFPGLPLGGFGENLSVEGASEHTVCIGDVWRAGTAVLQVASARKPCFKISTYWQRPELTALVEQTGRIGWYLRVLEEGALQAGAEIALLERPHPEWTVTRAYRERAAYRRFGIRTAASRRDSSR